MSGLRQRLEPLRPPRTVQRPVLLAPPTTMLPEEIYRRLMNEQHEERIFLRESRERRRRPSFTIETDRGMSCSTRTVSPSFKRYLRGLNMMAKTGMRRDCPSHRVSRCGAEKHLYDML